MSDMITPETVKSVLERLNKVERSVEHDLPAWAGEECPRCGEFLGPWHLAHGGQEFFGCAKCGYGVTCNGEGQRDQTAAADILFSVCSRLR